MYKALEPDLTHISRIDFIQPLDASAARLRYCFAAPHAVLAAHTLADVRRVIDAAYAAAQRGHWCVGYVRYEAAAAFDTALQTHPADGPVAWFAVYDAPQPWPDGTAAGGPAEAAQVAWAESLCRADFDAALTRIQQAIAAGALHQVNYTAPLLGALQGSAEALFAALQRAQPGGYAAHIDTGGEQVLSVSPELFFDWRDDRTTPEGGSILLRPLKSTASDGATPEKDAAYAEAPKERAENVLIVDQLRNELSRIVLPTMWQMASDLTARTRPGTTLTDVFAALFPCGSVTGAPKVGAMQMIRALESAPRGVYCGTVGVVRPVDGVADAEGLHGVAATFNVPVRTVVLQSAAAADGRAGGHHAATATVARCGMGSAIITGCEPASEWAGWRRQSAFLQRASPSFEILETLGLQQGRFQHTNLHVRRMTEAAAHFGFACNAHAVRQELQIAALQHREGAWRVRLLLAADGTARTEAFALVPTLDPVRLQLAGRPFEDAHSEFVRFKTTHRAHYAAFAPTAPGVFDTVLWNAAGEITESTFGNIAAFIDDRWVTPPLSCGLLPGIGRAVALRDGWMTEAVLRVDDVPKVQNWAFVNSLRGWLAATLTA